MDQPDVTNPLDQPRDKCEKCEAPKATEHSSCPRHSPCWSAKGVYTPANCTPCTRWCREVMALGLEEARNTASWDLLQRHVS